MDQLEAIAARNLADVVDQRVTLFGISWKQYEAALEMRGEHGGTRIAFLDGALELMTPSTNHELIKKTLARLLETWSDEAEIDLIGVGSWTLKKKTAHSGIEPDECYWIGEPDKPKPDLAIEVVWTSGGVDKLEIYQRLGVKEVWIWEGGALAVHVLGRRGYEQKQKSALLPTLDLHLLASFAQAPHQARAVRAFRAALRGAAKP